MNPTTNVNMANLGGMGGPVGAAPMTMMNNVAAAQQGGPRQHAPINENQRTLLNTYIYEYFIRFGMHDCARTLLQGDNQVNVVQNGANRRRDENGNVLGNGVGGDAMDTDSKDEMDGKLPDDLPPPKLPRSSDGTSFLHEWFCLFWEMYSAQRKPGNGVVHQYVNHTQTQSRLRQSQQQEMLRQMRPDMTQQQYQAQMMRMQNGGGMAMAGKQGLVRTAMANNHPQAMLHQAKQNQMQRDPSDMDGNRQRAGSPNAADNAPSPSKRPRLGEAAFNPNQPGMRQVQGIPGQQGGAPNLQHAHQLLISNGINPAQLSAQQLQQFSQQSPAVQAKSIATYSANLQHHQSQQMPNKVMGNAGMPQGQGSPMMPTGPDGTAIGAFYNPEMGAGPGGMRPGPGGPQAAGGSNHALQDYQLQLMLLEQQNKKRLMMARQEQDNMGGIPRDGPNGAPGPAGPPGPNGQIMPDGSPQAPRSGASPNPAEQMKRGTPQMNSTNMGSPHPDGSAQSRGSPNAMNFMGGEINPGMAPHFFKDMNGSMVPNGQMAGMRPPSSHPNQQFAGPVNPQMMAGRGQQAPGNNQGNPQIQWQGGPNNNQMMPQGGPQGQQVQGTPQQRNSMPPPSGPAAAASNANNRTQTSSPQQNAQGGTPQPPTPSQSTKPAPKKKEPKNAKSKAAAQKKSNTNLNAAAAAAATSEPAADAEPPTPATPMTPGTASAGFKAGQTGGANAGAAAAASGPAGPQPTAASAPAPAAQPQPMHSDTTPGGGSFSMESSGGMDVFPGMDFTNPMHSSDVLNDFDFDAFLHEDGENNGFDFNSGYPAMEGTGEIGAE